LVAILNLIGNPEFQFFIFDFVSAATDAGQERNGVDSLHYPIEGNYFLVDCEVDYPFIQIEARILLPDVLKDINDSGPLGNGHMYPAGIRDHALHSHELD
jgi:hypothetical protein